MRRFGKEHGNPELRASLGVHAVLLFAFALAIAHEPDPEITIPVRLVLGAEFGEAPATPAPPSVQSPLEPAPRPEPPPAAPEPRPTPPTPEPRPTPPPPEPETPSPEPQIPAPAPEPTPEPAVPDPEPTPLPEAGPEPEPTPTPPEPRPESTSPTTAVGESPPGPGADRSQEGRELPYADYLAHAQREVRRHFRAPAGSSATFSVRFTIHRDGSVSDIAFVRRSGSILLDMSGVSAIEEAAQRQRFGPLPETYPNPSLTIVFDFNPAE